MHSITFGFVTTLTTEIPHDLNVFEQNAVISHRILNIWDSLESNSNDEFRFVLVSSENKSPLTLWCNQPSEYGHSIPHSPVQRAIDCILELSKLTECNYSQIYIRAYYPDNQNEQDR